MTLSTFLLQTVTPAVLPASDGTGYGYEYYDVLGLQKYADISEIRKAYRAKSLQLHPDKIAQRGGDATAAAAEYERIQEAYAVLSDDHKRAHYHSWQCSVARYQFIECNHGLSNPVAMHENLMTASFADKTRLLVLSTIMIILVLLQPILIAAKVNGISNPNGLSNASWVVILIPTWIVLSLYVGAMVVATGIVVWKSRSSDHQKNHTEENTGVAMLLATSESIAWLAGIVMLAQQWDRPDQDKLSWHVVSTPFYIAVLIRMATHLLVLRQIRAAQNSMVSTEYLQRTYGNVEEVSDEILSKHIVVTTDASAVVAVLQVLRSSSDGAAAVSDEDVEAVRVQTSPEFRAAEKIAQQSQFAIGRCVVLYITMIALIAAKLQNQIEASWWVVFVPVWVALGLPFLKHFFVCLCVMPPVDEDEEEEEEIVEIHIENDNDDNNKEATTTTTTTTAAKESINMFAAAEGVMDEFNNNNDEDIMAEPELLTRKADSDDDEYGRKETTTDAAASLKSGADDEPASDKTPATADDVETGNEQPTSTDNAEWDSDQKKTECERDGTPDEKKEADKPEMDQDDKDKSGDDDDEHDEPHIDEETSRKWQERMHADESDFVEQKFKALTGCCCYCSAIIILCLIVGKLEQDYGDGGDGGYSAFWVLFPVFLVSGILLLCCSVCIYGTKEESEAVENNEDKPNDAEEAETPAVIPAAAPAEATENSSHSATAAAAPSEATDIPDVAAAPTDDLDADIEAGLDMDDLD